MVTTNKEMKKILEKDNRLIKIEEDNPEIVETLDASMWLQRFLRLPEVWRNKEYLDTCVIGPRNYPKDSLAIMAKHIKLYYKNYVNTGMMTENELRETITVMIKEKLILSKHNLESTRRHIEQGFYREYLDDVNKKIQKEEEEEESELQQLVDDIDWGGIL